MILTFVFVNRNAVTVAVKIKKMCVNMNKGRGYVMVYHSKKRQVYCEYEDDIQCDRTVVWYTLPLFSLNGIMNKQWRLKQCNNLALSIRTYRTTDALPICRWYDNGGTIISQVYLLHPNYYTVSILTPIFTINLSLFRALHYYTVSIFTVCSFSWLTNTKVRYTITPFRHIVCHLLIHSTLASFLNDTPGHNHVLCSY